MQIYILVNIYLVRFLYLVAVWNGGYYKWKYYFRDRFNQPQDARTSGKNIICNALFVTDSFLARYENPIISGKPN